MGKLKVLFIWPKNKDMMLGIPLGFAYLFSNCCDDRFEFKLIDCVLDNLLSTDRELAKRAIGFAPDVVAVSASSTNFEEGLAVLQLCKEVNGNISTILGGPHATAYGYKAFDEESIDFLFMGEAEVGFKDFLYTFLGQGDKKYSEIKGLAYKDRDGKKYFSEPARIGDLDKIISPDYDAINLERYIEKGYNYLSKKERCAPIYCTRGCPYECKFCSVPSISGKKVRKHSVTYLVDIVEYLYREKRIRGFNVVDDNFTFDVSFAKSFCREIIKLGFSDIEFNSPNGIRMQRGDFELWELMKQAGWDTLTVAPESGSLRVLELMKKNLDPSLVPEIVADMKRACLEVNGFFILGFPGETVEDLHETEQLIRLCQFDHISVTFFQPMPGTPIYDELIEQGALCDQQLPGYFGSSEKPVFTTKSLSGVDLVGFRLRLYKIRWLRDAHAEMGKLSSTQELGSLNKVFIVGAGNFSVHIINKFKKCGIPIEGIVDEFLVADKFHGLKVCSIEKGTFVEKNISGAIFFVAISVKRHRLKAFERLVNSGVDPKKILYFEPDAFDEVLDNYVLPILRKILIITN